MRGNFAAVARERNIDPSLSRASAHLEQELGIKLLQQFHLVTGFFDSATN